MARRVISKPVAVPAALRAKPGDRTHRVRAGESLWTIATDLLGADASTAAIAHKVDQLWARNRAAIGTGDPNLLFVGTKLNLG
jgi:nucleoid-associated protein YgaU